MRQIAALALLATGRAFVLPANAPRTTAVKADMLEAPLDLVRDHHAYLWQEFIDEQRTPLDLVSSFHEGVSREFHAADVSQLRSPWGHAG